MKKIILYIIMLSLLFSQSRIRDWKVETSTINIQKLVSYNGTILGATHGGLLKYEESVFSHLSTMNGLADISLNTIHLDPHGYLWIGGGAPNGFIQIMNPISFESMDVFNYDLSSISVFNISESIGFAAYMDGPDVGLLKWIYSDGEWIYSDIYKNFANQFMEITGIVLSDDAIYIGTDIGLWAGTLTNNLKDPNNWAIVFPEINNRINAITQSDSFVGFSHDSHLYEFSLTNPGALTENMSGENINFVDLNYTPNNILKGISENRIYDLISGLVSPKSKRSFQSIVMDDANQIVIGTDAGLAFYDVNQNNFEISIPNSPVTNHFTAVKVLEDGRIVCGSKYGLSIFEDDGWRNILEITRDSSEIVQSSTNYDYSRFIADTVAVEFGEYISDIEQGPDGRVYCAIRGVRDSIWWGGPRRYGGGVIHLDIDDPTNLTIINSTDLDYFDEANGNNYQLVMDLQFDKYGNLWIANPYAVHKREPIHVIDTIGDWFHYSSDDANNHLSRSPGSLTFDNWGRLWVAAFQAEEANSDAPNGGLFMLDYYGYVTNPNSFEWTSIIDGGSVWSIAMGNMDRLFYLTPTGLNYFDLVNSPSPEERENPYAFFPNISFGSGSKLRVDYRGNIWALSPTNGIHVLLDNTSPWPDINGLRKENSFLTSDEVIDVDFDSNNGLAYIATSNGLNIFRIPFKKSYEKYSEMKIYPSPFHLPADTPLIVDGLTDDSSMMVMTLNGHIIRKIPSAGLANDGYQLQWDGKDEDGNWLGSGVYLLSIYDYSGQSQIGKVTVIKH